MTCPICNMEVNGSGEGHLCHICFDTLGSNRLHDHILGAMCNSCDKEYSDREHFSII